MRFSSQSTGRRAHPILSLTGSKHLYSALVNSHSPQVEALLSTLKDCSRSRDLTKGKSLHAQAINSNLLSNTYILNSLIPMYSRCGSLHEARQLFTSMRPHHTVISWNALILGYVENGETASALHLFAQMHQEGCRPNHRSFVAAVKACTGGGSEYVSRGMILHSQAAESGLVKDIYLASALVELYSRYGKLKDAQSVFDEVEKPDVALWTALMTAYNENGRGEVALELLASMQDRGCSPDVRTFLAAAKACRSRAEAGDESEQLTALEKGMSVHSKAANSGFLHDNYLSTTFLDMYAKCGALLDARRVFDGMSHHNVVAWNVLLLGYMDNGQPELSLQLFSCLTLEPDAWTYVIAVRACVSLAKRKEEQGGAASLGWLSRGMDVHSRAAVSGHADDVFLATSLINMYCSYGTPLDARTVFDRIPYHNVVVWNALLLGLAENGQGELSLQLYRCMPPGKDSCTYLAALKACGTVAAREQATYLDGCMVKLRSLEKGVEIFRECVKLGLHSSLSCSNSLIDLYVKTGNLVDARRMFESLPCYNSVSWNTLMSGYVEQGDPELALETFERMEVSGCLPDGRSYVAAVKACGMLASSSRVSKSRWMNKVEDIHRHACERGLDSEGFLTNSVMDFYVKVGEVSKAVVVFDRMNHRDVVSWTVLLLGYVQADQQRKALKLLEMMLQEGYKPNSVTLTAGLKACSSLAAKEVTGDALQRGKALHYLAAEAGLETDVTVSGSLLDMYCKCESLLDARAVFDSQRTGVSWSTMILGYIDCGQPELALNLYTCMRGEGFVPDTGTFAAVLKAAGSLSALERTKSVHSEILKLGLERDVTLQTSLVDVYGKCGKVLEGQLVFDGIPSADTATRNALMTGYSRSGESRRVLEELRRMGEEGLEADEVSFTCVLSACSHGGLVAEGTRCFEEIERRFGVKPSKEHYVCLVDMLGRGNEVEEALKAMESMPFMARDGTWRSLLEGCRDLEAEHKTRMIFTLVKTLMKHELFTNRK